LDASACARQDAAADEVRPHLRPQPEAAAEKSVGQARDVQEQDAWRRQSELQAAPAAGPAAPEPYTPAVARFAEQSCAALAAAESPDAPQSGPQAERLLKPPEALPPLESLALPAFPPGVPAARLQSLATRSATLPQERRQPASPPEPRQLGLQK
jgi:hypothetical protein